MIIDPKQWYLGQTLIQKSNMEDFGHIILTRFTLNVGHIILAYYQTKGPIRPKLKICLEILLFNSKQEPMRFFHFLKEFKTLYMQKMTSMSMVES